MKPSPSSAPRSHALTGRLGVRKSPIDGKGLFARASIPARRKIGEYAGERIPQREARRRARKKRRLAIVETDDGYAIDASVRGNALRYINHSCSPNTCMRIFRGHIEFYSLRPISRGEELTCRYGNTHHDGKLRCKCGSANCRGAL